MLSRTAKHALSALRCLARDPAARLAADALASETGIPANYLSKILNELRKRDLVEAERGWGGGFRLRPATLDRPIRDIVTLFDRDESGRREECLVGLAPCDSVHPCPLHAYWTRIREIFDDLITTTLVRDLVDPPADRGAEVEPSEER